MLTELKPQNMKCTYKFLTCVLKFTYFIELFLKIVIWVSS